MYIGKHVHIVFFYFSAHIHVNRCMHNENNKFDSFDKHGMKIKSSSGYIYILNMLHW